jgi:hypothetical protein
MQHLLQNFIKKRPRRRLKRRLEKHVKVYRKEWCLLVTGDEVYSMDSDGFLNNKSLSSLGVIWRFKDVVTQNLILFDITLDCFSLVQCSLVLEYFFRQ